MIILFICYKIRPLLNSGLILNINLVKYYLIILVFDIILKYLQYIATINITDTNVYNMHIVINNLYIKLYKM